MTTEDIRRKVSEASDAIEKIMDGIPEEDRYEFLLGLEGDVCSMQCDCSDESRANWQRRSDAYWKTRDSYYRTLAEDIARRRGNGV